MVILQPADNIAADTAADIATDVAADIVADIPAVETVPGPLLDPNVVLTDVRSESPGMSLRL